MNKEVTGDESWLVTITTGYIHSDTTCMIQY